MKTSYSSELPIIKEAVCNFQSCLTVCSDSSDITQGCTNHLPRHPGQNYVFGLYIFFLFIVSCQTSRLGRQTGIDLFFHVFTRHVKYFMLLPEKERKKKKLAVDIY